MHIPDPKALLGSAAAAFLAQPHKLLIGKDWVESRSGETLDVVDPATGKLIAQVQSADAADADLAVAAARVAFESGPWSLMTAAERGKYLWRLADILSSHAEELAQIESLDTGRPVFECQIVDVPGSVNMLQYMAGWAGKINGETMNVSMPGDFHTYTIREPIGVVAIIVPWNYPLELAVWRMAPALAAGCTVILKPAEQTPLSTIRLGQLVQEAGFPPGVINVLTGYGESVGAALSAHMDVDAISFTGSTATGKLVAQAAVASNLKRVFLELGGKSPAIVLEDADLDIAIPGVAGGIFFSAGQVCTASSRLFVHEKIFDKVVSGIANIARGLKLGHGLDPQTRLGPLVSSEQLTRVRGYLEQGRADGVEMLAGGNHVGGDGYFVEATVMANVSASMSVYREEIFGPVLCAMPFSGDIEEAARLANDTIYGLHASIWTQNLRNAHLLARRVKSGNVCINTHNFFDPAFPMGGYKQSGWGRAAGFAAIEHYTEMKGVVARL